jgi:Ser/Thr protein kinase RdoA (MazF antagonist)
MIHPAIRQWVATTLGDGVAGSLMPARWGFSTPTAVATLADGTRQVIQLVPDPATATRGRAGAATLEAAGVRVPRALRTASTDAGVVVVTQHVQGRIAASLIGTGKADEMARAMGRIAGVLRDHPGPPTSAGHWADPARLGGAAERWAPDALRTVLVRAVEAVSSRPWTPSLSHGDFVPANALVDGSDVTLLDTADVGYRHPLVDAAWWCLMVRHHHPLDAARLVRAFLRASETEASPVDEPLAPVALLRSAELAALDPARPNVWELVRSARAWVAEDT